MNYFRSKSAVVLCSLLPCALFIGVESAVNWKNIPELLSSDAERLHSLVNPLAYMTGLTYLATNGTYYKKGSENVTLDGWVKDNKLSVDRPNGGLRGLVFAAEDSGPVVVAFRGSDLQFKTRGGLADVCFGATLLAMDYPSFCSQFSREELDYYGEAEELMNATMAKYPKQQIVATGHSAGCAIAAMTAVVFESTGVTAICFSLPGVLPSIAERTEMSREEILKMDNVFSLAFPEDPILTAAVMQQALLGKLYVWESLGIEECTGCCNEGQGVLTISTIFGNNCKQCFSKTHGFENYFREANNNKTLQEVVIPRAVTDCSNVFTEKVIKKEVNGTTLEAHLSKQRDGWVMVFLLVVILTIATCLVAVATKSCPGKFKTRAERFVELEPHRA